VVAFWKVTDRIGRVFNMPLHQLSVGATCDDEPLPVLVFWPRSDHPEHLPLGMVERLERVA
jgi:hypothetical protein